MRTDFTPLLANNDCVIALVGASEHPEKYGSIIYLDLKKRGYPLLAVNPHRTTVYGDPCYPNLAALPARPDIIDLVVPSNEGINVVEEAISLGLDNIWLQPGAESASLVERLEASGLDYDFDSCIMVSARRTGQLR